MDDMTEAVMAFVGAMPCGCVVGQWVDVPSADSEVANWIRDGLTVTYVPVSEAKWTKCPLGNTPGHGEWQSP